MELSLHQGTTQIEENLVGNLLVVREVVIGILQHTELSQHVVEILPTDIEVTLTSTTETTAAVSVTDYTREAT